jgi:hypothetical protein
MLLRVAGCGTCLACSMAGVLQEAVVMLLLCCSLKCGGICASLIAWLLRPIALNAARAQAVPVDTGSCSCKHRRLLPSQGPQQGEAEALHGFVICLCPCSVPVFSGR